MLTIYYIVTKCLVVKKKQDIGKEEFRVQVLMVTIYYIITQSD